MEKFSSIIYIVMTINELNEYYTTNIKRLRAEKNLSQNELAEKIHLSEKYLSAIETGKKWGSFETLLSLAEALSVEPYELLLPKAEVLSYNTKRTKQLMKSLRRNLNEMLDSVEIFLEEDK